MYFSLMEISATAPLKMDAIKTSAILMIVIVHLLIQIIVEAMMIQPLPHPKRQQQPRRPQQQPQATEEVAYSIVLVFIVS